MRRGSSSTATKEQSGGGSGSYPQRGLRVTPERRKKLEQLVMEEQLEGMRETRSRRSTAGKKPMRLLDAGVLQQQTKRLRRASAMAAASGGGSKDSGDEAEVNVASNNGKDVVRKRRLGVLRRLSEPPATIKKKPLPRGRPPKLVHRQPVHLQRQQQDDDDEVADNNSSLDNTDEVFDESVEEQTNITADNDISTISNDDEAAVETQPERTETNKTTVKHSSGETAEMASSSVPSSSARDDDVSIRKEVTQHQEASGERDGLIINEASAATDTDNGDIISDNPAASLHADNSCDRAVVDESKVAPVENGRSGDDDEVETTAECKKALVITTTTREDDACVVSSNGGDSEAVLHDSSDNLDQSSAQQQAATLENTHSRDLVTNTTTVAVIAAEDDISSEQQDLDRLDDEGQPPLCIDLPGEQPFPGGGSGQSSEAGSMMDGGAEEGSVAGSHSGDSIGSDRSGLDDRYGMNMSDGGSGGSKGGSPYSSQNSASRREKVSIYDIGII